MKSFEDLNRKSPTLPAGKETLDLYLKNISWNLRSMMGQADVLETEIIEVKKQLRIWAFNRL
jgi:hypothetical protein